MSNEPEEGFAEGMDNDQYWTMSKTAIARMVCIFNPEIWAMRNECKKIVCYSDEEIEQIQLDSGIYRFTWDNLATGKKKKITLKSVYFSREKFDWDAKFECAIPIDSSKFIMTVRGWDWKAMPYFLDDCVSACQGADV